MKKGLNIGVIGLGRIGKIHLGNLLKHKSIERLSITDTRSSLLAEYRDLNLKAYENYTSLLQQENPNCLFICSSTPSHFEIIMSCCEMGIHVFCEKPLDLDIERIRKIKKAVDASGIILQVGFNRRFDPDYNVLKSKIEDGVIGAVHQIIIASRDPDLPSMDFIASSGGMFMDMSIHDFDMARFLGGTELEEIYCIGQRRVSDQLAEYDDIDTASVLMKFKNGITCSISNSRKAVYGYDQRIEVFGEKGMLSVENNSEHRVKLWNAHSVHSAKPLYFFLERYAKSYELEADAFIKAVMNGQEPPVTVDDALIATAWAAYANQSLKEGQAIKL